MDMDVQVGFPWMTHKRPIDDALVKVKAHKQGVSKTCSWPIKKQRLTNEGEIVGYASISDILICYIH